MQQEEKKKLLTTICHFRDNVFSINRNRVEEAIDTYTKAILAAATPSKEVQETPKVQVFALSDGIDANGIILTLDEAKEWIEGDSHNYFDGREYTIKPVLMTEEELNQLPEADL